MFKLAFVTLLCAQAFAMPHGAGIDPRVIGGFKAKEGEMPFAVSLRKPDETESFCSGALLTDRYVVTAARCIADKEPLKVGVGSVNMKSQTLYDVEKVIIHPHYDFIGRLKHDIGLIKLKTPVKLGGNVQTIKYPAPEKVEGKNCTAAGWGHKDMDSPPSDELLYVNGSIMFNLECTRRTKYFVTEYEVCLLGEIDGGMFFDDAGGPMFYKGPDGSNYLVGVYSWSFATAHGIPDFFTRVSYYTEWFKQVMV